MQRINQRMTQQVNLEGFRPPRPQGGDDVELKRAVSREQRSPAGAPEIRLLLIEDSERDAAHIALVLRRAGTKAVLTRVETREEMMAALASQRFDAVISDYHLPRFSAPEALEVLGASGIDLPFIVVSGAVGEDTAVELMRAGANDYVLKDRLARLAAAVDREIQQAQERRSKRRAETLFHAVIRASPDASVLVDRENMTIVDGSLSFQRQFLGPDEALSKGMPLFSVANFSQPERITQLIERGKGTAWYVVYYTDVVARVANVRCHTVEHEGVGYAYLVIEDVTEQHYLKAAFDAVEDAVLIIGSEQRLLYANRSAESLFGNVYFQTDVEPVLQQVSPEPRW
ncbi:MAG TPA: response regulator, partial [Thermoanaerobaculia bacterium]|nr:response regulator [Thermoanaerobaculia bacterium]